MKNSHSNDLNLNRCTTLDGQKRRFPPHIAEDEGAFGHFFLSHRFAPCILFSSSFGWRDEERKTMRVRCDSVAGWLHKDSWNAKNIHADAIKTFIIIITIAIFKCFMFAFQIFSFSWSV